MNVHFTEFLYNFILIAIIAIVVIWIIGKLGWGMEVEGFSPVLFSGVLFGVLFVVLSTFIPMLLGLVSEHVYGWWSLVIFPLTSVISLVISVQVVKGVRFKNDLGVLLAFLGINTLILLSIVLGSLRESAVR
jgi:hypothetical protein